VNGDRAEDPELEDLGENRDALAGHLMLICGIDLQVLSREARQTGRFSTRIPAPSLPPIHICVP